MNRRRDILILLFFLIFFFITLYLLFGTFGPSDSLEDLRLTGGDKVALVRIIGGIYNPEPYLEQFEKIEESSAVKAVVLRLETPGGSIAASQEIYMGLARLRDDLGIPIVVSMGNIAASGGYYVAMGADTIIANPGTITGSIGVILSFLQYYELFDKIGLESVVVKSGKFKDTGSPFRSLETTEKEYLQALIDDSYNQFIEVVAEERQLDLETVELLADGRVYTGRQAKDHKLIDLLGGLDDAIDLAGELGGISGKPDVVDFAKREKLTIFDILFGDLDVLLIQKLGLATPLKYEMPRSLP